jgi:hypothetical protein
MAGSRCGNKMKHRVRAPGKRFFVFVSYTKDYHAGCLFPHYVTDSLLCPL